MQLHIMVCEITLLTLFIQAQPNDIHVESCIRPLYSVSTILNLYWCYTKCQCGHSCYNTGAAVFSPTQSADDIQQT